MKRVVFLLMLALCGASAVKAQKVETKSRSLRIEMTKKEKTHLPFSWQVKAGAGVTITNGYGTTDRGFNYNVALGFKKQFTSDANGWYWGGFIGSTLRFEEEYTDYSRYIIENKFSLYVGPTIGINKPINDLLTFDAHLMAGYQHSFNKYGNYHHHVIGEIGFGIWINRFLVELAYQPSFIGDETNHSILLNLGFRF